MLTEEEYAQRVRKRDRNDDFVVDDGACRDRAVPALAPVLPSVVGHGVAWLFLPLCADGLGYADEGEEFLGEGDEGAPLEDDGDGVCA